MMRAHWSNLTLYGAGIRGPGLVTGTRQEPWWENIPPAGGGVERLQGSILTSIPGLSSEFPQDPLFAIGRSNAGASGVDGDVREMISGG